MNVVFSRDAKNETICHRDDYCPYANSIKHKIVYDSERGGVNKAFRPCKYCFSMKHSIDIWKDSFAEAEAIPNLQFTYYVWYKFIFVETFVGFWKIVFSDWEFVLYHRNTYVRGMGHAKLAKGEFHRQKDCKAYCNLSSIIAYIVRHDCDRMIADDNYRKMRKQTKNQRRHYNYAKYRANKKGLKDVYDLFDQIESCK